MSCSSQARFLGDSDFSSYGLQFHKDERIRLVQHFYEEYCALDLTVQSDRSQAMAGLQQRLAQTFESVAIYGILWRWPERMLLWHATLPGQLSRINYKDATSKPPSWSWMAHQGPITFMDIPFAHVDWTGNIREPLDPMRDQRLRAKASNLWISRAELMERAVFDTENVGSEDSWMCVLVGKQKSGPSVEDVRAVHYVLLVRLMPYSEGELAVYERIGVAMLQATHFSVETRSVSIA